MEPEVCGATFDLAMMSYDFSCDQLARAVAGAMVPWGKLGEIWDTTKDKTISIKVGTSFTLGFDTSIAELQDSIPSEHDLKENLSYTQAVCADLSADHANNLMTLSGCIGGACDGTHYGMSAEVTYKVNEQTYKCDAKVDAVCWSGANAGESAASFGDGGCECAPIKEITEIDLYNCRAID
jgi:hypothetical protein